MVTETSQNLGDVGYDSNDILLASYDWRLSFPNLEESF
jgi:hypothetical protein